MRSRFLMPPAIVVRSSLVAEAETLSGGEFEAYSNLGGKAVIITFHALGRSCQERFFLGVFDDYARTMIDRPDCSAYPAGDDVFGETSRM